MQSHTLTSVSNTRASARTFVAAGYDRLASSGKVLWATQGTVALIFLFAGVSKLVMPADALDESAFPVLFLRFIGVCETLGAVGLVLPSLLRIRPGLTPLAAAGLVIIMTGAVASTVVDGGVVMALIPLAVGLACAFVATSRARTGATPVQPSPQTAS